MRIDADLGGDKARDAGGPVQQRIAHGAADLVEREALRLVCPLKRGPP
jgi:hypothetical protein